MSPGVRQALARERQARDAERAADRDQQRDRIEEAGRRSRNGGGAREREDEAGGAEESQIREERAHGHARTESTHEATSGLLHFCVTVDGDFAAAVQRLRDAGVPLLHDEPVVRGGARGEGLSIYVTDPDGYVVEVKEY